MPAKHLPDPATVLAIGAANMDIAASSPHRLAAGDSTPGTIRHAPGGVARNVAENLARLGHAVHLWCAVGDDLFGRSLLAQTRAAGVDVAGCWTLPQAATSTYLALHGPDGDMDLAINDMAIVEQITPALLAPRAVPLRGAACWLLDGNLPPPTLQWLFAQSAGVPVFVDPVSAFKCRRFLPWLSQIHTLKLNRIEAQTLWGQDLDSDAALAGCGDWLHRQGVQTVVVSLGARGAYWSAAGGPAGWAPALPVTVCSATGAGDALMAGLLHGHLHRMELPDSVAFGTACAALTLTAPQANHAGLSVAAVHQLQHPGAPP